MKTISILTIKDRINSMKMRSAWAQGVQLYALEILLQITEEGKKEFSFDEHGTLQPSSFTINELRYGYSHWEGMSRAGMFLIYDEDIAKRLCNPSELVRCKYGERNPNRREDWLACQGRALYQARGLIVDELRDELNA